MKEERERECEFKAYESSHVRFQGKDRTQRAEREREESKAFELSHVHIQGNDSAYTERVSLSLKHPKSHTCICKVKTPNAKSKQPC